MTKETLYTTKSYINVGGCQMAGEEWYWNGWRVAKKEKKEKKK
ncbi:MAG: hypothetical protein QW620_08385 [Thermoplasmata archaeon]